MRMFTATGRVDGLPGLTIDMASRLGLAAAPAFAVVAWISAVGSPA